MNLTVVLSSVWIILLAIPSWGKRQITVVNYVTFCMVIYQMSKTLFQQHSARGILMSQGTLLI